MRKPASIMVAIGLPLARDDEAREQDEDSLNRERDGEGDVAEQVVMSIVECLNDRGPGAVRQIRSFAQALEAMADAHFARDAAGVEDAAADAHKALSKIFGD
jgi:hypothetical protein